MTDIIKLRILHLNVQSIMNKIDNVSVLLSEKNPDIISVVEHWCKEECLEIVQFPGYKKVTSFCRSKRGHGGSVIFARNGMDVKVLKISKFSEEMVCESCAVRLNIGQHSVSIVSVYRPPMGDFESFLTKMSHIVQFCIDQVTSFFLCGDLNVNYLQVDSKRKQLLDDLFNCFQLKTTSLHPTRIFTNISGQKSCTKIDYIVTNVDLDACETDVFPPHFGDHYGLLLDHFVENLENTYERTCHRKLSRNMSPENLARLANDISETPFDVIYENSDVNFIFDSFVSIIKAAIDFCCPLHSMSTGKITPKSWITPEIKYAREELKNLYWVHKNLKTDQSFDLYRRAKTRFNNLVKSSKFNFHENLIRTSDNECRMIWNIVNQEIGRKTKKENKIILQVGEVVYSESTEVANAFSGYFSSVAKLSLELHYGRSSYQSCTTSPISNNSFYFHPVDKSEVMSAITQLKNKNQLVQILSQSEF